jgi:hypothetical protein
VTVAAASLPLLDAASVLSASLDVPTVSFEHLLRLSDDTGLFEHARGVVPRREHGYCLDDVARGLVVLSREPGLEPRLVDLATCYLGFVSHAQDSAGRCHNRLGYDRHWHDEAGVDDCWGRAVWGLGSLAASQGPRWLCAEALDRFEVSAACRSPWRRATAFASLGASAVLRRHPDHGVARRLLVDALPTLGRGADDPKWPWPEARLSYANATVTDALMAAGDALGEDGAVAHGVALLAWLFEVQTADGHLSPVPSGGWARGEARPGFDQQPIEAAALADAAARAWELTGDPSWAARVSGCVAWFAGRNDSGAALYDPITGGGFDGLERDGRNANQGAESTLAALSTLQLARRFGFTRC